MATRKLSSAVTYNFKSHGGVLRFPATPFQLRAWATHTVCPGRTQVLNPADGSVLGEVPNMGKEETTAAINAATAAFPAWAARTAYERSAILRRYYDLILRNVEGLGVLLSLESGKPLEEAKGEIAYAADYFSWYAEEVKRPQGEVLTPSRPDRRMLTSSSPVGPCALLTPWNFPAAMPARKIAPALAAGCTIVFRPATETPLSALALVQLGEDAGVPPGVLNLVVGADHEATAGVLTASPHIKKVSFTGSVRVGKLLMRDCAPTLKRLSLELGGQAPFIVFQDADVDAAVEGAMAAKFRNAGQTCVCANTFYVHEDVAESFTAKLVARVRGLVVGDGLCPGVNMGPLISPGAVAGMARKVEEAVKAGAVVAVGGVAGGGGVNGGAGNFFMPTVLTGLPLGSAVSVACEEVFGPIAPIVTFKAGEEGRVVEACNAATVGLAAYIFTRDTSRAWRVGEALGVGMVGINTGLISAAQAPFGGVKESGFGREGAKVGLGEYQSTKYTMWGV